MAIPPANRLISDALEHAGIPLGTPASEAIAYALRVRDEQWRAEIAAKAEAGRWAVRFSNYEPAEIDSIHDTEEDARKRCAELNRRDDSCMWEVEGGW